MKKREGFSTVAVVVTILIAAILCIGTVAIVNHNNQVVHYENYSNTDVIAESEDNGQIADHVRGNAEAPVVVYEYANFQCVHCALMNPMVEKAIEASNGQLAVVFRNVTWAAMQNSKAAASAAEAAGLQGYWDKYADKLFTEQVEWSEASGSKRTELFNKYFNEVSDGQGDLAKFQADVASDAVAKKIEFDVGLANEAGVDATPTFFVEGQKIELTGGNLEVNGQTVHYSDVTESEEDFVKLMTDIIAAKTSA